MTKKQNEDEGTGTGAGTDKFAIRVSKLLVLKITKVR